MSARDGFVLGCRLLAIYFFVDFASRVITEFLYVVGPEASGSLHLPSFALPTLYLFAAVLLWFYSPGWAEKTFPNSSLAVPTTGGSAVPKTIARLLAIYLIAGSISVVVDFVIKVIVRSSDSMGGIFWSPPASWNDFGASFVWLVTGLLLYFGSDKVTS